MSFLEYNAYVTIFNHTGGSLTPFSNSNPPGTFLWNNQTIPKGGVFTSGWGAVSSKGVNGVAKWRAIVSGRTVEITIQAQVERDHVNGVYATSSDARLVDVSVGEFEPLGFPLRVNINVRNHVAFRGDDNEQASSESTQEVV